MQTKTKRAELTREKNRVNLSYLYICPEGDWIYSSALSSLSHCENIEWGNDEIEGVFPLKMRWTEKVAILDFNTFIAMFFPCYSYLKLLLNYDNIK